MQCILCRNKKKSVSLYRSKDRMYGIPGWFLVSQCPSCGLLSIHPKLKKSQLSTYYPPGSYYSYVDSNDSFLKKIRRSIIGQFYNPAFVSKLLFTFFPVPPAIPDRRYRGKIMDIGCGSGETLKILKKYGWDTYGVDIDQQAVRLAGKAGLRNVSVGTHEKLSDFPDNYFSVIRAYHVIEHVDTPERFVRLIAQKLQKNGICILGTPNADSFAAKTFRSYWFNLDTPRHQYIFSPGNLHKLLSSVGLSVSGYRFFSGGGILGSIQYVASAWFHRKFDFVNNLMFFLACYPLDWILDVFGKGDVFIMEAKKV